MLLITGNRRQAKQFCFQDADFLVVGESQGSSRCSDGKYPMKPPRPEGDSQTIDTYRRRNNFIVCQKSMVVVREPAVDLIKWLRPKDFKVCSYVEKYVEFKNQALKSIRWYTI